MGAAEFTSLVANNFVPQDALNLSPWDQVSIADTNALIQVKEGVYIIRGRGLASMTFIEGPEGIIVVDTFMDPLSTEAALEKYFSERPEQPIVAVLMTYSYLDSFGGLGPVVERAIDDLQIIVPEAWVYNSLVGRESWRYNATIFSAKGFKGLPKPTDIVSEEMETRSLGGLTVHLVPTPISSMKAELLYFIPELNVGTVPGHVINRRFAEAS